MPDYLIGGSPAIKRIKASLEKYSADLFPLVIVGEPGVGKSLLASRIHAHSLLKDRELETVNFKILSDRDQRIRLMGGCPPDIPTTRRSVLELPTTVVIKHIDAASRYLQEYLCAAMQSRALIRLGDDVPRTVRCRLMFLFHQHPSTFPKEHRLIPALSKLISKYQIITIPPLKKRKQDIPELAQHFFAQFQIQRRKIIGQNFNELLLRHRWKENILELKSFIHTLKVLPPVIAILQQDRIELSKINMMIEEGKEFSLKSSLSRMEKNIVARTLSKYNNVNSKTSQALGLTNKTIRNIANK
jgi:two-component system, NtrC family, response regulator HydG